jgi:hypothetical protein
MSLTQDAASDRRWAAARSIAEGVPPDRGRRRRHLVWLLISALIVGCLLFGVVLGVLLPPLDTSPTEEDGWIARAVWAFAAQGIGVAWLHMSLVVAVIVSSGFAVRDYRRAGAYLDAFGS